MFAVCRLGAWLRVGAVALAAAVLFAAPKASALTLSASDINFGPVTANFTEVVVPVEATFASGFFLNSLSISGSTDFGYLLGGGGGRCDLNSSGTCIFGVTFTPTTTGPLDAILTVNECNGNICQNGKITLEGQGIAQVATTPVPGALPLFVSGLGVIVYATRRRQRRA